MATTCRLLLSTPTLYPLYLVVGLYYLEFRKCVSELTRTRCPTTVRTGLTSARLARCLAAIVIAGVRQRVPRFRAVVSASHDRAIAELARHTYGGHDYICEQLPKWCASTACAPWHRGSWSACRAGKR